MIRAFAIAVAALAVGGGAGCDAPVAVDEAGQAITNGTVDTGDPAVVGIVVRGAIDCSGTVIAPRVVVTAAHCLVGSDVDGVVIGTDLVSGTVVAAVHAQVDPRFDPIVLAHDVGLVLLAEPAPVAPVPRFAGPLDASFVGRPLRLVGFGQISPIDGSPGAKREGTATIAAVTDTAIEIHPDPSLTCGGDSGGPAFLDVGGVEYLAGITSAGDAGCAELTRSTRADVYRELVDAFVAETTDGAAAPGARCYYPAHCAAGTCFYPDDAPGVGYCATGCADDDACADGMICVDDACRYPAPSPGALGAPCDAYTDCDSLLCAQTAAGGGACSVACDPAAASCPDGFRCEQDGAQPALHACFEVPAPGPSAGCAAGRTDSLAAAWLIAVVAALARRRRRGAGDGGGPRRPRAAAATDQ